MNLPAREKSAASAPHVRVRPARPSLLLVGAVVLLVAASLGTVNPGGYVWVERLLHHPFLFGVAVCALLIGAIGGRVQAGRPRAVMTIVAAGLSVPLLGVLMVALDLVSLRLLDEVRRVTAPHSAPYTAVVSHGSRAMDPVWVVSIRQSRGVLSRAWPAACLNGYAADDGYQGMTWVRPTQLSIRTVDGRQLSVRVDQNSGQPRNHVDTGGGC